MKIEIVDKILENIPVETEIEVENQLAFINLIHKLGYRDEKMWDKTDDHILDKLLGLADAHTKTILSYERKFVENFVNHLKSRNIVIDSSAIDYYFKFKENENSED